MGFFLLLLLNLAFAVIGELLKPRPKFNEPKASSLGDFQVPTAEEGRPIPIVFGTCHVKGSNVVWYGDLFVRPIQQKVKTGIFSSKKITTGYYYYIGAQLGLCHGQIDTFNELRFDDRAIPNSTITIDASNDALVIGTISPDVKYTALVAHGVYSSFSTLAAAVQTAMVAAYNTGWRCVWGFDIIAGVTDEFQYRFTENGADGSVTTAHIASGLYDTGAALATGIAAALNANEAAQAGGARASFTATYSAMRFRITCTAIKSNVSQFHVIGQMTNSDRNKSIFTCIGVTFGANRRVKTLPGTYVSEHDCAPYRFMFSAELIAANKLETLLAGFTCLAPLGLRREVPTQSGGLVWFGWNVAQELADALNVGTPIFYSGPVNGTPQIFTQFYTPQDAGDVSGYEIHLSCGLGIGTNVDVSVRLNGGPDPDSDGSIRTQVNSYGTGAMTDLGVMHDFVFPIDIATVQALRAHGGFDSGISTIMVCGGAGVSQVMFGKLKLVVPQPPYAQIGHLMAQEDRNFAGIVVSEDADKFNIAVHAGDMFGGDDREGGVAGEITLYKGTLTQVADPYLTSKLGSLPGYRGICYAVLGGRPFDWSAYNSWPGPFYVGTTPYLKLISFVISRYPNQLGLPSTQKNLSGDANPAAMLYEIMTNDRWGLAIPSSSISVASFLDAGQVLASEQFGLSMMFDSQSSAHDMMDSILRHIDGVIFPDPGDGLIKIRLARANYGPADPIMIDESRIASCQIQRPSVDATKNVVKITYTDRVGFVDRIVQAQNRANIEERGGEVNEEEFPFAGISNSALAQKVAARVLKTVSYPFAVISLEVDRIGWSLRPGDVFRFSWSPLGIVSLTCRVLRITTGTVLDGKVKIDAAEDIFAVDWTAFSAPGSGWIDPIAAPSSLVGARLLECPYGLVVGSDRIVLSMGGQGSSLAAGYKVWSDTSGGDFAQTNDVHDLTPTGLLASDLMYTETQVRVATGPGMNGLQSATSAEFEAGQNLVLIDDEIIAWQGIADLGDGTFLLTGCIRGVLDTMPEPHGAGLARAYFISAGLGQVRPESYGSDVTIRAKLPTYNSLGSQQLADVSEVSITTNSRAQRPYAPRNVKVNLFSYPGYIFPTDAIQISWSHRNRLSEWSYADGGLAAAMESSCTYTLRFYGRDGLLKKTYSGLTGTSQTWTSESSDSGGSLNEIVTIELECVNAASQVSFQKFRFTTSRQTPVNNYPARPSFPVRRRTRYGRAFNVDTAE